MAKNKKKTTADASDIEEMQIRSWDDWFRACGEAIAPVKRYEDCVREWEKMRADDELEALKAYAQRHDRSFWEREGVIYGNLLKKMLLGGMIGAVAGFIAGFAFLFFTTHAVDFAGAVPALAIGLLLGVALGFLPMFLKGKSLERKMADAEPGLARVLRYVAPKYRNSFCLDAFYDMYCSYGIANYERAIDVVDEHIKNNARVYEPVQVLFDVRYHAASGGDGTFVADPEDEAASSDPGAPDLSAPGLPADAELHIHEGVDDPEERLAELIGMESVKKQVRQMKSRVEFFGEATGNSGNNLLFLGPAGSGKALADDTPIPVADERGYVPMGDLRVGDVVYDENGDPTRVLGVYHQGELPAYRVTFGDGSCLICNDEHMFAVRRKKGHKVNGPFVDINVHQMMNEGVSREDDMSPDVKFWVPLNGALSREAADLPLDPYVLGVLIGDGCLTDSQKQLAVSSDDEGVVSEVARRFGGKAVRASEGNYSWIFDVGDGRYSLMPNRGDVKYVSNRYFEQFDELSCVFGKHSYEKRIPVEYFNGSEAQRLALLQGLMDTDGTVSSNYRITCKYCTTSEGLAVDFVKLATSLGIRVRKHGAYRRPDRENARPVYEITILCEPEMRPGLFLASRKRALCESGLTDREGVKVIRRYDDLAVKTIEPLGFDVSMTCIYVDAPSHLYQAGEEHVVTHNTEIARIITRILYDFGYIRANRIMEVDGDYLKSPYVGQTGERVNAIVTAAKGGVLFVDEAYLLYDEKDTNSTGKEAIGVLLKAMEDLRDDLVVILAGYEDGMNRLLASNEGFSSRIKYKIYFDDYSAEELGQIFKLFMEKGTQSVKEIEADAYAALVEHFEVARTMPGFGNARAARNALDRILDIHADRYMDGLVGETAKMTIVKGDVDAYVADERERLAADGRNFMATSHLDEKIISFTELKTHTHDGAEDPASELEAMVGLDEVKAEMQAYLRRSEFFRDSGGAAEGAAGNLNMALVGPPGTGKSSLIRIITGYLYQAGYIRENRYVDVTGDFLKAPYVGQTGKRTEAVVEYSKGMLLFVDEAYLLGKTSGTGSDFGAEAVGVLVNAMEKSMGELVVAFAGYGPEMERFFDMNQGLRSRIGTVFELPPYSGKELMKIFQRIAYGRGFACDKGIWPAVAAYVKANMADPSFGNARAMRQLVEKAVNRHVDRYSTGEVGEDARMVLDAADIAV